jgi:hypothetical protein
LLCKKICYFAPVLSIVNFTEPTNQPDQPQKTHFQPPPPKKEAKKEHKKNTIFKKL